MGRIYPFLLVYSVFLMINQNISYMKHTIFYLLIILLTSGCFSQRLGVWEVKPYINEFGERTKDKYVYAFANAGFSDKVIKNGRMHVEFVINKTEIKIKLSQYQSLYNSFYVVEEDEYLVFKVKEKRGKTWEFETRKDGKGYYSVVKEDLPGVYELLSWQDALKFAVTSGDGITNYWFTLRDNRHFQQAMSKL